MQENGPEITMEGGKVRCVIMVLEGAMAQWMVSLHNDDAPELRNSYRFIVVLPWPIAKLDTASRPLARDREGWLSTPRSFMT